MIHREAQQRLDAARLVGASAIAVLAQFALDTPHGYFGPMDETTLPGVLFVLAIGALCLGAVVLRIRGKRLFVLPAVLLFCTSTGAFLPPLAVDPVVAGSVVLWNLLLFGRFIFQRRSLPLRYPYGRLSPDDDTGAWRERNGPAIRHLLTISLLLNVVVLGYRIGDQVPARLTCLIVGVGALGLSAPFLLRTTRRRPAGPILALALLLAAAATAGRPDLSLSLLAAGQAAVLALLWAHTRLFGEFLDLFYSRPAYLLLTSFLLLIAIGTLFLSFPAASATGRPLAPVDALFTATSAACVTGLIVLDTGHDFSTFGHVVILVLIQAGGLSIMVLSAFAAILLGRDLGLRGEGALGEMLDVQPGRSAQRLVLFIVLTTLVLEAIGAVVLTTGYLREGYLPSKAAWFSAFHAVSAFCNAGFSLHSDSLVGFRRNPAILLTVAVLIILGGLGFTVLAYFWHRLIQRRSRMVAAQARIVLLASGILLAAGAAFYAVAEWNRSLAGLGPVDKALNAFFQSVTLRTAGFNSVALDALHPATVLMMITFMFIGASPGGTGGGIKTTTAVVLIGSVLAVLQGRERVTLFRHSIPRETVYRSAAIAVTATIVIVTASTLLLAAESAPFDALIFETFSAFGTVGLSLGATAGLGTWGKLLVSIVMLGGRVGPLTLALLLGRKASRQLAYPDARVMVG